MDNHYFVTNDPALMAYGMGSFSKNTVKTGLKKIYDDGDKISEEERGLVDSTFLMSKAPIIIILNSDEGEPIDNLKLENAKSLLNQDTNTLPLISNFGYSYIFSK